MAANDRRSLQERSEALARFDAWAVSHPTRLAPADAIAAAGRLYELLPASARARVIDATGVMTLHRLLRQGCAAG